MLRKLALVTCIAFALGRLQPMWDATQTMLAIQSANPSPKWWIVPAIALAWLFSATMPVFYFTLYRNRGTLRFPKRLRRLSLAAALVFGAIVAVGLPGRIESPNRLPTLLDLFADVAYILLLVTLYRRTDDESSPGISIFRPLRIAATVVVIVEGLWVAYNGVQLVLAFRTYALQAGPGQAAVLTDSIRTLLNQACLFTAPFIVCRSLRYVSISTVRNIY